MGHVGDFRQKGHSWMVIACLCTLVAALVACSGSGVILESARLSSDQTPTSTTESPVTYNNGCEHTANTQAALNECANSEVRQLQNQLSSALHSEQKVFGTKMVRAAQSQWTKFVKAECTMEANPNRGGSIYPLIYEDCVRDLTVTRIEETRAIPASQPR